MSDPVNPIPRYKLGGVHGVSIPIDQWCVFQEFQQLVLHFERTGWPSKSTIRSLSRGPIYAEHNYYGLAMSLCMSSAHLLQSTKQWLLDMEKEYRIPFTGSPTTCSELWAFTTDYTLYDTQCMAILKHLFQLTHDHLLQQRYLMPIPVSLFTDKLRYNSTDPSFIRLYKMDQSAYYLSSDLLTTHACVRAAQVVLQQFCDSDRNDSVRIERLIEIESGDNSLPGSPKDQMHTDIVWPSIAKALDLSSFHLRITPALTMVNCGLPGKHWIECHVVSPLTACLHGLKDLVQIVTLYWLLPCQWHRYFGKHGEKHLRQKRLQLKDRLERQQKQYQEQEEARLKVR